jgi:hypothetical protein
MRRHVSAPPSTNEFTATRGSSVDRSAISRPSPSRPSRAESGTGQRSSRIPLRSLPRSPNRGCIGSGHRVPAGTLRLSTRNAEVASGRPGRPVRAKTITMSETVALPIGHFSPESR